MQNLLIDLLNSKKWYDGYNIEEKNNLNEGLISSESESWINYLKSIFSQNPNNLIDNILSDIDTHNIVFFPFLKPFLQKSISEIDSTLKQYSNLINIKKIHISLIKSISQSIMNLAHKTLIYELNKERLNQRLKGNTPENRYKFFIENNLTNYTDILKMLLNYPVLSKLICELMQNKITNLSIAIERLWNDKKLIEENFNFKLNEIVAIEEMGDSHNGGNTVLRFIDKCNKNIIYKPRSLYIDVFFQELLTWFNKNGVLNKFKIMGIVPKKGYGWQEYINHQLCTDELEVKRFFQRQGQYLAIFHMLNATDFHYENIISNGEHPFYIDLESLLHPILEIDTDDNIAIRKCTDILKGSVIRTTLLPLLYTDKLYSFDVSGLGARGSHKIEIFNITNKNTDIMKMEKQFIKINSESHIPAIKNNKYYSENNIDELIKGFKNCYAIIMKNKDCLISIFTNKLQNIKVRVILRTTALYSKFLDASIHPKYLINCKDRTLLFNLIKDDKSLNFVSDLECKALMKQDIPYFYCKSNAKNLYSKYGNKMNFLKNTPLDNIIKKVSMFSNKDYSYQKYFIEKSLLVNKSVIEEKTTLKSIHLKGLTEDVNIKNYCREIFLKEAITIADKLEKSAIKGDDGTISWICINMDGYEHMQFDILDNTLYSGIAGICLFYAYLNKITKVDSYLTIAKSCLKTMLYHTVNKDMTNISAFIGDGSTLYCLANLYILWNESWILDEIIKYLKNIKKYIKSDTTYDFLGGCAGLLSVCIDIYNKFHIKEALDISILCGNHLINNYTSMGKGIGWVNKHEKTPPLAGLAHGNAGICYSLIKLYSVVKEEIYLTKAFEGITYEDSLYSKELNNWRDLRKFDLSTINQEPIAWCNGAMGIGLARLSTLRYYKNDIIKQDFINALNKTIDDSFIDVNYCLCHGDLGNIEMPLMASIILDDSKLKRQVYLKAASIINDVNTNNKHWKCGIPGRYETESFMIGISGIGYELLRLYDNKIPNILILDMLEKNL